MSTLYEQIEEEENKLKEVAEEAEAEEEELEESEEEEEPQESIEEVEKKEPEPEAKEEEKEEEQKPDASAYARMRRENRELAKKLEEIEAAQRPKAPEPANTDPEPSKQEDYEQWLEWKDRQNERKIADIERWKENEVKAREHNTLWNGAIKEFQQYENAFQKDMPDYEQAAEHLKSRLKDSISLVSDHLSPQEVDKAVSEYILKSAAKAVSEGYNPAESLYRMSKEKFGFVNTSKPAKPDLRKIDSNRKKSASPLQSGGKSGSASLTAESVADMSMAEFAKLTPSQIRELESQ